MANINKLFFLGSEPSACTGILTFSEVEIEFNYDCFEGRMEETNYVPCYI